MADKYSRDALWGVFDSDTYGPEIERVDSPDVEHEPLASDDEALGVVLNRAMNGNEEARAALAEAYGDLFEITYKQTRKEGRGVD